MSPYEMQSIEIASRSLTTSIVADILTGFAIAIAIVGGIVAYKTLQAILAQIKAAQWSTLLSLEQDMASRRDKFNDFAKRLADPSVTLDKAAFEAAKESYLNSLDRLASMILNGQFPEKELKQDYRDLFKEIIRTFPADFSAGTHYRKVLKLHDKWEDNV